MNKINLLTLFPEVTSAFTNSSIMRRAQSAGLVEIESSQLRDYALDKHKTVDDRPFGGKQGMLLKADVLEKAILAFRSKLPSAFDTKIVYASPRGARLDQEMLWKSAEWLQGGGDSGSRQFVFVCGRYEGVDERFVDDHVDLEFSMGDFVLTGGEIPTLAFVDGLVRLLPGAVGDARSVREESFSAGFLEHPQFTRPKDFSGGVPAILTSGDHAKIENWKLTQAVQLTAAYRPELLLKEPPANINPLVESLWHRLAERLKKRLNK